MTRRPLIIPPNGFSTTLTLNLFSDTPKSGLSQKDLVNTTFKIVNELKEESDLFLELLISLFSTIEEVLDEEWKSFGIVIGKRGDTITPLSLLQLKEVENPVAGSSVVGKQGFDTVSQVGWELISMYRIIMIRDNIDQVYTKSIKESVKSVFRGSPFSVNINPFIAYGGVRGVIQDRSDYMMLVAALDMFMSRFHLHKYAPSRVATINSRDKGCTTLQSLQYVDIQLNLRVAEFVLYIYDSKVRTETINVLKAGEELGMPHSYSRYLVDFRLVIKSPYSASANSNLHHWCQMVGAIEGVERCGAARMLRGIPPNLFVCTLDRL